MFWLSLSLFSLSISIYLSVCLAWGGGHVSIGKLGQLKLRGCFWVYGEGLGVAGGGGRFWIMFVFFILIFNAQDNKEVTSKILREMQLVYYLFDVVERFSVQEFNFEKENCFFGLYGFYFEQYLC